MDVPITNSPLPNYEHPPLVETVLGVQFDRLPDMKNAHLGSFWNQLDRESWPHVSDAPPLSSEYERFGEIDRWTKGFELQLSHNPTSRLRITNKEKNRMIQVQNGRFHFNWLRGDQVTYPRYDRVKEEFCNHLNLFLAFAAAEKIGTIHANQWEVTYLNQILQGTVWNTIDDWDFFRPLAAIPSLENLIRGESFSGEWHFEIPEKRGRLHIHWQHVELPTSNQAGIRLTLTARGPVKQQADNWQAILDGLDLGRGTIVGAFKNLMSDRANQHWGLKDA